MFITQIRSKVLRSGNWQVERRGSACGIGQEMVAVRVRIEQPVRFIDPEGMWSIDANGHDVITDPDAIKAILRSLKIAAAAQDDDKPDKPKIISRKALGCKSTNYYGRS